MPELPEVEAYTRYFAAHALRQTISAVRVNDERILGVRRQKLVQTLVGAKFSRVRRHGKHFFADAGKAWLHLHFGMSGDLSAYDASESDPRFARVIFDFKGGRHLAFEDMRLFGVVDLTPDPDTYIAEHDLGPDPLGPDFELRDFRAIVSERRGAAKSLLMSQDVIAGVGNLYADETLYQSAISPRRPVDRLSPSEVRTIHARLKNILTLAVARRLDGGALPAKWLFNHREEGERCPRCGGTIQRTVVFGRTTYFCATHQR